MKNFLRFLTTLALVLYLGLSTTQGQTKPTYKIGSTTYSYTERYATTGLPKVKRSESVRKEFLQSRGYNKTPYGYEVDHIVPLHKGGADAAWNMQLLPKSAHRQKSAIERSNYKFKF